MIIEESDFRLTSITDHSPRFDLELLKTIKPKGGEVRQELKDAGYGMPLETCIARIIQNRISNQHPEAIQLKEYFKAYKEEQDKFSEIIKQVSNG